MENYSASGLMSVDEYLELEKTASVKHEFVGGFIHAMTGASRRHNRIASNISALLWNSARSGPCRVFQSDMKVRAPEDTFYYPDVMVACGDEPEDEYTEDDPCLIVEVTSPSTGKTDRREKLAAYRRMPELKAYLIVSQEKRWVERHWRDENGEWHKADLTDDGAEFPVPCPPGTRLSLQEIYEGL